MKIRLLVPETPGEGEPVSGGYRYDFELVAALQRRGHDARVVTAPERGAIHLVDGLCFREFERLRARIDEPVVGLVHLPAALLENKPEVSACEARFLAGLDAVHFVSQRSAEDTRVRYDLPPTSWVVPPGIEHFSPLPRRPERLLVSVGHVLPTKGVEETLELLTQVRGPWRFEWLGALDVVPSHAEAMRRRVVDLGLAERVNFRGRVSLSEVTRALSCAAALIAMSPYESWGFALAEALRAGVPIIGTCRAGVVEHLKGEGFRDEDLPSWLESLLSGDERAQRLQAEAQRAGARLPSWADAAALTEKHLEALCAR